METHPCPVCGKAAEKRCSRCNMAYYCSQEHQKQDWKQHKKTCKPFKMETHPCPVCGKAAEKRCSRCDMTYYCSQEHQKQDWKQHKKTCKPFKVAEDSRIGRHLVATRNIKEGETVLRESPLVRGPDTNPVPPMCLACLKLLSRRASAPCEKCGWPLCTDASCRQSKEHLPECEWAPIIKKPEYMKDFSTPNPLYSMVTIVRLCYARCHQPEIWERLSKLMTHEGKTLYDQTSSEVIMDLLRLTCNIPKEITKAEMLHIFEIVAVNAYMTGYYATAVYDVSSLIEHSCLPNCRKVFSKEGELVLIANRDIKSGEHISASYIEVDWGTTRRFQHLLSTKNFACSCVRCTDNTEMGTYFSAILCQKSGCGGPMLPKDLRALTPASRWTCTLCGDSLPHSTVGKMLEQIDEEQTNLKRNDASGLLGFLNKWKIRLHRNHYFLWDVEMKFMKLLTMETINYQALDNAKLDLTIESIRHSKEIEIIVNQPSSFCRVTNQILDGCLYEKTRRLKL